MSMLSPRTSVHEHSAPMHACLYVHAVPMYTYASMSVCLSMLFCCASICTDAVHVCLYVHTVLLYACACMCTDSVHARPYVRAVPLHTCAFRHADPVRVCPYVCAALLYARATVRTDPVCARPYIPTVCMYVRASTCMRVRAVLGRCVPGASPRASPSPAPVMPETWARSHLYSHCQGLRRLASSPAQASPPRII